MRVSRHAGYYGHEIIAERRHMHSNVLQCAEHAIILNRVMATSHDTIAIATAIADRLVENSEIIIMEGASYRKRDKKENRKPE